MIIPKSSPFWLKTRVNIFIAISLHLHTVWPSHCHKAPLSRRRMATVPPPSLTAIDATDDATYTDAQVDALKTTDNQGRAFMMKPLRTLMWRQFLTWWVLLIRALEAASGQLFAIESGQAPGLKREIYDASAPSESANLMLKLGFVLERHSPFHWACESGWHYLLLVNVDWVSQSNQDARCHQWRLGGCFSILQPFFADGCCSDSISLHKPQSKSYVWSISRRTATIWARAHPRFLRRSIRNIDRFTAFGQC